MNNYQVKKTPRQKSVRTKEKIIKAAMTAFKEKGFDETTIQDICLVSKIAVGTFYHHFSSKQDLISAMIEDLNSSLANYYNSLNKVSYRQVILQVVDFQIETYLSYGVDLIAKMYSGMAFSGTMTFVPEENSIFLAFKDALSRGQIEGQYSREYPLDDMVETVYSLFYLNGVLWCNHHDIRYLKVNARKKIESFLQMISTVPI